MVYFCGRIMFVVYKIVLHFGWFYFCRKVWATFVGGFTFVEKLVYACGRFTLVGVYVFRHYSVFNKTLKLLTEGTALISLGR